jgi:hypothetical protein
MRLDNLFIFFIQQDDIGYDLFGGVRTCKGGNCDVEACLRAEEEDVLVTSTN